MPHNSVTYVRTSRLRDRFVHWRITPDGSILWRRPWAVRRGIYEAGMMELLLAIAVAGVIAGVCLLYRQMRADERESAVRRRLSSKRGRDRQLIAAPPSGGDHGSALPPPRRRHSRTLYKVLAVPAVAVVSVGSWLKRTWREHHPALVAGGAVTVAAAVVAVALFGFGGSDDDAARRPSGNGGTELPTPPLTPGSGPEKTSPPGEASGMPEGGPGTSPSRTSESPGGMDPDGGSGPSASSPGSSPPTTPTGSPTPSGSPTGEPTATPPPGHHGLCLNLHLPPILKIDLCILDGV